MHKTINPGIEFKRHYYKVQLKEERSRINNLNLYTKELEKEQTKSKVSKRKKIIKITIEINKIKNRKTIEKDQQN